MNANANEIKELAPKVAKEHEDYEAALLAERKTNARLLAAVRDMVKPSLRAVSSRVVAGGTRSSAGLTTDPAPFRGVRLAGTGLIPAVPRTDDRGTFVGHDLYLSVEGHFVELRYDGTWSGVKGEVSTWTSTAHVRTPQEVAADFDVGELLTHLRLALKRQVDGDKVENTYAIRQRLARIEAAIKLVEEDL